MPDDHSFTESNSTWGVIDIDSADIGNPTDDLRVPSSKLPWAICKTVLSTDCSHVEASSALAAFESGDLTITCTILYPEQFDALRRTYDCERSMIESLARCVKWNASGGKSGSYFLKTRGNKLFHCVFRCYDRYMHALLTRRCYR